MLDFSFKRGCFRFREVAFGEINIDKIKNCDVVFFHSNDKTRAFIPNTAFIQKKQFTLLTDLTKTENEILEPIKKNCRYEIRRAERENATFDIHDIYDEILKCGVLDDFQVVYNNMFKSKEMNLQFNRSLIESALKAKQCIITVSKITLYELVVVYHAYLVDGSNAMLMYSASSVWGNPNKEIVNAIGRVNKFLHWKDILFFKKEKFQRLEWGGISDPNSLNGIDKFKMEFGGILVNYDNYIISKSLKGSMYLKLFKWRHKSL